jgi:hypothetical protein
MSEIGLTGGGEVTVTAEQIYNCRCGHYRDAHSPVDGCRVPYCACDLYNPPPTADCLCSHEYHDAICTHRACGCVTYRPATEGTPA